jgi:predicted regulator of Ras-like GTPase activity (Roadblock/LC7/MglB family)
MRTKFAGLLRGLLRHFEESEADALPKAQPFAVSTAATTRPQAEPRSIPAAPPNSDGNELKMPLRPILEKLPAELRARMTMSLTDLGEASISIPVEQVLPQLALGSVKITFGQLREAAPSLFRVGEEYDSLPAVLPLNTVLSRLNSGLLSRNPVQKTVSVPSEIAGPFSIRTQPPAVAPAPARSTAPVTLPLQKTDTQIKPRVSPVPVAPRPVTPKPVFTQPTSVAAPYVLPPTAIPAVPRKEAPVTPIIPSTPVRHIAPVVPATPEPTPVAKAAPVVSAASAEPDQKAISAPLAVLSEKWPEALRQEIAQWNLANAQVVLPIDALAAAMKSGRVKLTWRDLRSRIKPAPMAAVSVHESVELELPLKVIAPLFLQQNSSARPQSRLTVDKSIPNLFFGFPSAEMEAPAVAPVAQPVPEPNRIAPKPANAKLSETNYYVWSDSAETPRVDASEYKRPQAPATDFSSRYATPKEIVARAMAMSGVAGALVALPDGLMVACQLPPSLNADTVAAFLPQIFDRLAQCTRELRMGALNNLKFTVGNVPWNIFRVNAVYFAAFGRDGEPLPSAQLASLAGELDRKKQ